MSKTVWWLIVLSGSSLIAMILYSELLKLKPAPVTFQTVPAVARPLAPAEAQIRFPVPHQSLEKPLPVLDVSDSTMEKALGEMSIDGALIEFFQLHDFVRRVVATIDNLPREKLAARLLPVMPPAGSFVIAGRDSSLAIGADNSARYAFYARLANALDTGKLVALYVRFYPLFQQAYRELGYPKGYFNDRLIDAIDNLLATPEAKEPIRLIQPKVLYRFADPRLEALSAGQKLLLRVGSENAALIKLKLRDIRGELMRPVPAGSQASAAR